MKALSVIFGYSHHYGGGSGDSGFGAVLVVVGIVVVVGALIIGAIMAAQRRKDLAAVAASLGIQYSAEDPFDLPDRHANMRAFDEGHSKRAYNTIYGKKDGLDTIITDYQYTVGSGKNSHTYRRTYCLVTVDMQLPSLHIRPENFLDTIASWVGFDDIDFEFKEFNDAFYVRCDDKRAAYDIINPKMMEYLLQYRELNVEMLGNVILAHYGNTIDPNAFAGLISAVHGIARLLPAYTNYGR